MKQARKGIVLLLALMMLLSMSVNAYAADAGTGSIKIKNPVAGQTYKAYKIFDVQYDVKDDGTAGDHYSYTIEAGSEWFNDVKNYTAATFDDATGTFTDGTVTEDAATGVITGKGLTLTPTDETKTVYAVTYTDGTYNPGDFSRYLDTKRTGKTGIPLTEQADGSIGAASLALGYYLVDTSLGSVCSLDTTSPSVEIQEKNQVPKNFKQVKEDSATGGGAWKGGITTGADGTEQYRTGENDADIGQKVEFRSQITAYTGTDNLIFHDQMSSGLTFTQADADALSVKFKFEGQDTETELVKGTDYTVEFTEGGTVAHVSPDIAGQCTFHVRFEDTVFKDLSRDGVCLITIYYTATLNEGAKVGVEGNPNTSRVSYGDKFTATPASTTKTRTFGFTVFKFVNGTTDGLAGAKFELHANAGGALGDVIPLIKTKDGAGTAADEYRIAKVTGYEDKVVDGNTVSVPKYETGAITEVETNSVGRFVINGLDTGTYFLKETMAPSGFNPLTKPVAVNIQYTPAANGADGTITLRQDSIVQNDGTIKIANGAGARLPETGGIGTTIFYAVGGAMVLAAVVLLVTKKRMSD